MKCLILAGGSGDRLWPLSRKNYPKQFMEIRKGRSMFQEAVLRNIPFCDEFIVITNKRHESIVKGQLQDFQDLKYSILMEESPLKTAPSIVTIALNYDSEDEFLIVSTDNIIDGEYNTCITHLKEVIKQNKIALVVSEPKGKPSGNHYIENVNGRYKFVSNWGKNSFIDCGIYGGKVSVLLENIDRSIIEQCKNIQIKENVFVEARESSAIRRGIADVLNTRVVELVKAKISCERITDIPSYYNLTTKGIPVKSGNVIEKDCRDVKIINTASDRLVVANNLKDVIIANTRDAVFVTKADGKTTIKDIVQKITPENASYFEDYPVLYQDWGVEEYLSVSEDYRVSKLSLYAGSTLTDKVMKGLHVNYFVIEGSVVCKVKNKEEQTLKTNENISLNSNQSYEITNKLKRNITLIKTENKKTSTLRSTEVADDTGCFVKLKPVFKEFIWGGTKIRDVLKKNAGRFETIAESWELSAHSAGQSKVATGRFKGYTLDKYIKQIGKENLGWKVQDYERFPLLIKFIDATQNLSVQVHPDDDYAFSNEGDYGKNEMWYVMEADKNACIYIGFNKDVTKQEIKERIKDNTILEVLNRIPIKKGETYFLKAGTVHAIGAGCVMCEIQQSSNVTYRLYDYGRVGKNGKPREMHLEKALEVANLKKMNSLAFTKYSQLEFPGYTKQLLGQCKYFVATKYKVNGMLNLTPTGSSFKTAVVIEGSGKIGNGHTMNTTQVGDTWFFGSKETISVKGKLTIIIANI